MYCLVMGNLLFDLRVNVLGNTFEWDYVTASLSAAHATLLKSSCTSKCRERAQDFEVSAPFVAFSDYVTTRAQHVAMNKTPIKNV